MKNEDVVTCRVAMTAMAIVSWYHKTTASAVRQPNSSVAKVGAVMVEYSRDDSYDMLLRFAVVIDRGMKHGGVEVLDAIDPKRHVNWHTGYVPHIVRLMIDNVQLALGNERDLAEILETLENYSDNLLSVWTSQGIVEGFRKYRAEQPEEDSNEHHTKS